MWLMREKQNERYKAYALFKTNDKTLKPTQSQKIQYQYQ